MDAIRLEAKPRTPGKGPARAARRNKEVPCILYGHSVEPVPFQVAELDMRPLIYTDEFHRVELVLGKDKWDCIVKKVDFHPVSDRPFHVDFQVLLAGEEITLTIPVQYIGTPAGQKAGGRTEVFLQEIEITCLPKDIPDHIAVDVTALEIGDALHVSDLQVENVKFGVSPTQTLVSVQAPRAEIEEETEEEEGLLDDIEGGEEAEGDEGDEEDED